MSGIKKKRKLLFILLVILFSILMLSLLKIKTTGNATTGNIINEFKGPIEKYSCENCNVIMIVIDALRADHTGVYGYSRDTTPIIDEIAKMSLVFENAIAQSSWTRASVASILTGLYPKNHGANTRDDTLSENLLTLPEILKENNFNTYAFIANGNIAASFGFNQGFDIFKYLGGNKKIELHTNSDELNIEIIKTLSSIKRKSGNFIYIHYVDPHSPYTPKERKYSKKNETFTLNILDEIKRELASKISIERKEEIANSLMNAYDDEILFNDKMVGELIKKLKELKMYENSLLIITSDHGEEFLEHGQLEHGYALYEESIKIPLIIKTPNSKKARIKQQVSHINIMPTILEVLNINNSKKTDGESIFHNTAPEVYSELDLNGIDLVSIRTNDCKLIINLKDHQIKQFDLASNPKETENIYNEGKDNYLKEKLEEYLKTRLKNNSYKKRPKLDKKTLDNLKSLGYLK